MENRENKELNELQTNETGVNNTNTDVNNVKTDESINDTGVNNTSVKDTDKNQDSGKDTKSSDNTENKEKNTVKKLIVGMVVLIIIIIILLLRGCTGCVPSNDPNTPLDVEKTQQEYVEPEEAVDRSKQVSLPGWGGFTIEANKTNITKGFEFHNPESNVWYEDTISIDGKELETLVVDSGEKVSLDHYLALAGIDSKVTDVTSYDNTMFSISDEELEEDGETTSHKCVEAIGYFDGEQSIVVKCEDGSEHTITVTCEQDYYYMTFALYLTNTSGGEDTLLYQSGLVEPGKYIQEMEISQALEAGTYNAYVVIQPYRSDKTTKTNYGQVNITLTVA